MVQSGSTLTFTPRNWNSNQTVTIRGLDDEEFDGDSETIIELYSAISLDPGFHGLNQRM